MKGDDAIGEFQATKETRDVFEWAARLLETTRQKREEEKTFREIYYQVLLGVSFSMRDAPRSPADHRIYFCKGFQIDFLVFLLGKKRRIVDK